MRIKLIANPVSGGDARPRIQRAVAELQKLGAEVDPYLTAGSGDARVVAAKAVAEGFDRIVAAGGDGTLNEVVNGAADSEVPIAFLPFGTVNVFALEAGIPKQLEQACALAVHGLSRRITLGKINGDLFLLMASAGWDAEVVAAVRSGLKRLIGRLAYAVSALETLLRRGPVPLELITHEGKHLTGYGAVVSNCRYYGGRYMVTPGASMLRNDLEVCLLREGGRLAIVKFAAALLLKRPLMPPLVEFYTITSAMLQGQNIAVQVDGDSRGTLPAKIEVVPEAVAMVLPDAACSNP
jgi:diacylglycerol kinase (ATP)